MKSANDNETLTHFLEQNFDFDVVWEKLRECDSRGIHVYEEQVNGMTFYSYADIYSRVRDCATRLRELGISRGEYVLLSAHTDIRVVVTWLGLVWIGAHPATLPPRIAYISDDAYKTRLAEIIPYFKNYICSDYEIPLIGEACVLYGCNVRCIDVRSVSTPSVGCEGGAAARHSPSWNDPAFVQFTSGSTGHPKGIIITFGNMMSNIRAMYTRLEMNRETSCMGNWLPLFHDMGLVGFLLQTVLTQTMLVLVSPVFFLKRMFDFFRMVSTYGITVCCFTNTIMEIVLSRYSKERCKGINLGSLSWLGIGAEPVSVSTLERFMSVFRDYGLKENVLSPCYGLAESTLAVSIEKPFAGYSTNVMNNHCYPTVGPVLAGTEMRIDIDDDLGSAQGIIKVKGDSVSVYSLIRGEKVKTVDEEGYYDTHDIGCLVDGKLVIKGRSDSMFIINGEHYFPHEIESLVIKSGLLQRPNVVCISLQATESGTGEPLVVVIYEVNRITRDEKRELDDKLAGLIMKNKGIIVGKFIAARRGTILYTTSGKIRYNSMKRLFTNGDIEDYFSQEQLDVRMTKHVNSGRSIDENHA